MTIDISCILTLHHEGLLAHKTVLSMLRAVDYAEKNALVCEIIVVLDNASDDTKSYANRISADHGKVRIIETCYGDCGLARNAGIQISNGNYVAILDGDDLYSDNWLSEALNICKDNPKFVVHPEMNVYFGIQRRILVHPDQRDPAYRPWQLLIENNWTALCFASRAVFDKNPYVGVVKKSGYGFEDWHWNCEAIANGSIHVVAYGTAHFIRLKSNNSLNADAVRQMLIPAHSKLFDDAKLLGPLSVHVPESMEDDEGNDTRWDEEIYLIANKDVANGVSAGTISSGYDHWKTLGKSEGRKPTTAKQRILCDNWDEDAYLICNPDVRAAIQAGEIESGRHHWLRDGYKERRMLRPVDLPSNIIKEMHAQSQFELELFPSAKFLSDVRGGKRPPSQAVGQAFSYLLERATSCTYTHVFLVPWLTRGGADLVALHHINHLARTFNARILVICTENRPSAWLEKVDESVTVVEFGKEFADKVNRLEQELLIVRMLLKIQPQVIHNINSFTGWEIFARYGLALTQHSKLFVSLFGFEHTAEGELNGYVQHLDKARAYLTKVLTDSDSFIKRLQWMYGYDDNLFKRFHYPQKFFERFDFTPGKKAKVLWAGRFEVEKRPDMLLAIAKRLPDVDFDVYGTSMFQMSPEMLAIHNDLADLGNVRLKGAYDGFESIAVENYALLLYTTGWDGLPNVILEAMAGGLPVLAPDVGGISEVIPNESGFLMSQSDDAESYARRIRQFVNEFHRLRVERARCMELIKSRHSFVQFDQSLQELTEYLPVNVAPLPSPKYLAETKNKLGQSHFSPFLGHSEFAPLQDALVDLEQRKAIKLPSEDNQIPHFPMRETLIIEPLPW